MKGQKLVEEMSQNIIPESHLIKVLAIRGALFQGNRVQTPAWEIQGFLHRDSNKMVSLLFFFCLLLWERESSSVLPWLSWNLIFRQTSLELTESHLSLLCAPGLKACVIAARCNKAFQLGTIDHHLMISCATTWISLLVVSVDSVIRSHILLLQRTSLLKPLDMLPNLS